MYMVFIMVPLFQCDPVTRRDIRKYLLRAAGDHVIKHFSPVLHDQYEVIVQEKY